MDQFDPPVIGSKYLSGNNLPWISLIRGKLLPVWEQLAMDQFDPWQVVPRQVFTPYSHLLISTEFVFVSRIGCL